MDSPKRYFLFDDNKQLAGFDTAAFLYKHLFHDAGDTGNNGGFHLHCLDDSKYLIFLYTVTGFYIDLGYHAGDRRTNLTHIVGIGRCP